MHKCRVDVKSGNTDVGRLGDRCLPSGRCGCGWRLGGLPEFHSSQFIDCLKQVLSDLESCERVLLR